MSVPTTHNTTALLIGTGEFSIALDATTLAQALTTGYTDVGNVMAFTPSKESTPVEHKGSYRGTRTVDFIVDTDATFKYSLKLDEFNVTNLGLLFGGVANQTFTQSAISAASVDSLVFASAPVAGIWYDVTKSGNRVYGLTVASVTVSSTTLVSGVDYVHDPILSRIKFFSTSNVISGTYAITGTAPAITTKADPGYLTGLTPLTKLRRSGIGRLVVYDQNAKNQVVYDHRDFSCTVDIESAGETNGTSFSELTLSVTITAALPGTLWTRGDNISV